MNQESSEETKKDIIEFGKRLLFHNLVIKLLAIVGAVLVWLLIINIDDPYKTKLFVVRVETINEDALRSVNKVYEVIEGSTATVSVGGKRSVIDKLQSDDIRATADLSELSSVNAVAIKVALKRFISYDIDLECSQVLKVSLEDMESKQVKVMVQTEGTPAEGYSVGVVEVTGGSSVIDRVNTVRVSINVNGASQDFSKRVEPVAYDTRGNRIKSSTLTFSDSTIRVRAKLLQKKKIPVKVQVSGEPAAGYELVSADCLPEEIEIAGQEKILEKISEVVIPVDITGFTTTSAGLEQELPVGDYLDEDVDIPEEYQKVSVKMTLEKVQQRELQIWTTKILMSNVEDGYLASIYGSVDFVYLTFEGRESLLKELSENTISAYVDCSGLKEGLHSLSVKAKSDNGCKLLKGSKVRIVITKRASPGMTETAAPDDATENDRNTSPTASPSTE